MKKTFKQCFSMLLCVLFVLFILPMHSYAADKISLTVTFKDGENPVKNVECKIFFVAEKDEDGGYVFADDFKNYNVLLDTSDSAETKQLAETLAGYVKRDAVMPCDSGETDEQGVITFPNRQTELKKGIYLVMCEPFVMNGYAYNSEPIILTLPVYATENSGYDIYSVNVEPKFSGEKNTPEDQFVARKVLKLWKNDEESLRPDSIIVDLLKDDTVFDTVNLSSENNWRYEWCDLDKFNSDGTKIEWRVVERSVSDYTVSVLQDGITFAVTNTFNSEKSHSEITKRTVKKVWDDKGYENKRPKYITVSLLRNGEVYDTQNLSSDNDWQYSWENLNNIDANGNEYSWTVTEKSVSGYSSTVKQNSTVFILTNKYVMAKLPQTGVLWWPVPVFIALGFMFFIIGIVYKKRH